jgi:hypothetical protein
MNFRLLQAISEFRFFDLQLRGNNGKNRMQRSNFNRSMVRNDNVALRRSSMSHTNMTSRLPNLGKAIRFQKAHKLAWWNISRKSYHVRPQPD